MKSALPVLALALVSTVSASKYALIENDPELEGLHLVRDDRKHLKEIDYDLNGIRAKFSFDSHNIGGIISQLGPNDEVENEIRIDFRSKEKISHMDIDQIPGLLKQVMSGDGLNLLEVLGSDANFSIKDSRVEELGSDEDEE